MRDSRVGVFLKVSSVALLLIASCGSSGRDADAGGAVDAPADVDRASAPPSCLAALFAACPTATACVVAAPDGGNSSRTCFANGVKSERTGYVCGAAGDGQTTDVTKPDGSLCYELRHSASTSMACEVEQFTWSDGPTVVANGTLAGRGPGGPTLTITCAAGGESATYPGISSPAAQGWLTTPCTAGACP